MSNPATTTATKVLSAGPQPPVEADIPALIDKMNTNTNDEDDTSAVPGDTKNDSVQLDSSDPNGTPTEEVPVDEVERTCPGKCCDYAKKFYATNEFLILIIIVILLAYVYPPIGAIYVYPEITATWVAVMFIFLLAGLGLKTEEFSKAFQHVKFNLFVFVYNFFVDSAVVFGVSRLLAYYEIIAQDLADGMVVASSVPLTINMCVVLTQASGGDVAAAICNTAMWNLVGVFLSPALILGYIGVVGGVDVVTVFVKLSIRVVLPIAIGQLLKAFVPPVADFVKAYKPYFKKLQMCSLVFIVYTVFCKTFSNEEYLVPIRDVALMIVFVAITLSFLMILAWYLLRLFFKDEIKLRIFGLYGCTHKTVAMGIPLINAIYDGNPAIGLYTLPLLVWHPTQLVIGTFLAPRILAWAESFENSDDEQENDNTNENDDKGKTNEGKTVDAGTKIPDIEIARSMELEV